MKQGAAIENGEMEGNSNDHVGMQRPMLFNRDRQKIVLRTEKVSGTFFRAAAGA